MSQGNQDTFGKIISDLVLFSGVVLLLGYALLFIIPMALAFIGVMVLIFVVIGLALHLDTKNSLGLIPTDKIRNISVSITLIALYIAISKLEQGSSSIISSEGFYQQVFIVIGILAVFPVIFQLIKQHFTNPVFAQTPSGATQPPKGGSIGGSANPKQPSQTGAQSHNSLFGTPAQNTSQSPAVSLEDKTNGISRQLEDELAAYSKARISIGLYPALQQATFDGLKAQWDKDQESSVPDRIKNLNDEVLEHRKELDNLMVQTDRLSTLLGQLELESDDPEIEGFVTGIINCMEGDLKSILDKEKWNEANEIIDELRQVTEEVFQDSQNNLGGAGTKAISYEEACTVLGIAPDSDLKQAKSAYRKLVQIYHPDKETGDREKFDKTTEAFGVVEAKHK